MKFQLDLTTPHGQRAHENAAILAHEANRGYCEAIGDMSQVHWEDAPAWQIGSAMDGVEQIIKDPNTTPEQSHEGWCKIKLADGWVYGEAKDADKKTHHCLVDYDKLPVAQQHKDAIYGAVVREALNCYAIRTMTDLPSTNGKWEVPYSATDMYKTLGLAQVIGRATRISACAVFAYLKATGYPMPAIDKSFMAAVNPHVLLGMCSTSAQQAYDFHRAGHWPAIGPDFDQVHGRARVQWCLIYRIAQAMCWIEGVEYKSQEDLKYVSHSRVWKNTTLQQRATDDMVAELDEEILKNKAP